MKKLILFIYLTLPLINIFNILKPLEINYSAYFGIGITLITLSLILIDPKVKIDYYILYWLWFLIITFLTYQFSFLAVNYGYLIYPFTAISLYIFIKYYCGIEEQIFYINIIIFIAILQSLLGIFQSLFGLFMFEHIVPVVYESDRNYLAYFFNSFSSYVRQGTGTYEHFNGLAAYLTLAVPISYGFFKIFKNFTSLFVFILLLCGVVVTYSRGGLLGSLFGLFFIHYIIARKKIKILLVIFLSIISGFFWWDIISNYYSQTGNISFRYNTWLLAINYVLSYPIDLISGFGPYFFRNMLANYYGKITDLHSGQLQILLELGIVGYTFFILMIKSAIQNALMDKSNIINISIVGSLISFLVHQLFDNSFFGNTGIVWFSLLALFTFEKNS